MLIRLWLIPTQILMEHFNMGFKYGRTCSYNIIKIPQPDQGAMNKPYQKASIIGTIAPHTRHPSYFHSFGMTEKYFIFVEQPVIINIWKAVTSKLFGYAFADMFDYHPEWPTRFHIINRETGEAMTTAYITDSLFVFHHVNAYEKDDHLVVDMCCYPNVDVVKELYLNDVQAGKELSGLPKPWRFVLPLKITDSTPVGENLVTLKDSKATAVKLDDGSIHCTQEMIIDLQPDDSAELPRINYAAVNGKEYKYAYSIGGYFSSLLKWDVEERSYKEWKFENGYPSEPIFVPKPNATREDEGVVLSSVMTVGENNPSFLLILDGESFKEIARAKVPMHITYGLHGLFETD
ncbi:carotenoid-cleaving dioxygenase, mitochondrial-like [Ptychodera flava]|uniref:carotenoid-cleaving dioxygenase, mitochondrial-like n=1 Tax=Ptychodera flava TaxID=63121 RepID=UPI00396A3947